MSDDKLYEAMRAYVRAVVELEFAKQRPETRSVPEPRVVEGPPGKDGTNGKDGINGKDGSPGKDGINGIATLEDLKVAAREVFADFQVRTFADIYKFVYKSGESYERSNVVTWGGSLWLALADTKGKPGETPDWKLVLKK